MESENILLRTTTGSGLTAKGSALTHAELDANFIKVYQDFTELSQSENVATYSALTTYDNTTVKYAVYGGVLWKWIYASSGSGVTPGTNATRWERVFASDMSHEKNKDTALDLGGTNELLLSNMVKHKEVTVTVAEILNGYAAPKLALPDPTVSQYYDVISIVAEALFDTSSPGSTPYDGGSITVRAVGASEAMFKFTDFMDANTNLIRKGVQNFTNGIISQLIKGKGVEIEFNNGGASAPELGNYEIKFTFTYKLIG